MPEYEIVFSKKARRQIKKLDPDVADQIRTAIDKLAYDPRPQSSKSMKGNFKDYWRERTGNYRIMYEIRDDELLVLVVRVGHRKDIYK